MKKFIYVVILILTINYVAADLSDGLYSYFPMDDHRDILGYADSGSIGQVSYTPGLIGDALNITTDATNSMIYLGDSLEDRDNTFRDVMYNDSTINVWVYVREFDSLTNGHAVIMSGLPNAGENEGGCERGISHWELAVANMENCEYDGYCGWVPGNETILFRANQPEFNNEDNLILFSPFNILFLDTWTMITLTNDVRNNEVRIYKDGMEIASKTYKKPDDKGSYFLKCPYAIGGRPVRTKYGFPFPGLIDELGVWNRVLSEEEIQQLYNSASGLAYPFPEESVCGNGDVEEGEECDDGNKENNDGCDDSCFIEKADPLLKKFSPVFIMHPDEIYEFRPIESMLHNADLFNKTEKYLTKPLLSEDLIVDKSKQFYLDLVNVDITNYLSLPPKKDFTSFEHKVYGRVTEDKNNYTHLQYFLFYPFQKYQIMNHEGDWELVQVTLNPAGIIDSVLYHSRAFTTVYYDKELIDFVDDTHPVVLVSKGNHNNYAALRNIPFTEKFQVFSRLLDNLKVLDKISDQGTSYVNGFASSHETNYSIEQIDHETDWTAYKGLWGQKSSKMLKNGPLGPKYKFNREWYNPEDYSYAPQISFAGAFLYSPLDIHMYSSGNEITETSEEILFYTGIDSHPEAKIVSGENITLELVANGAGSFTLEFFYYDNETNRAIMTRYENVSNEENSTAVIRADFDTFFYLEMDNDGDGKVDNFLLPDDVIGYNFEYEFPDEDDDGVHDLEDNCISIVNPGQLDFDGNGRGDACDNPRYYKRKALDILMQNMDTKRDELAVRHLNSSLDDIYWEDDFTPLSHRVFVEEFITTKYSNTSELLAKADHLILEYTNLTGKNSIRFYEEGIHRMDEGEFSKAINFFMRAWILNKKA